MWSVQPVESREQFYCLATWIACKIALRRLCLGVSISCSLRLRRKSEISIWIWQVWCTGMICESTAYSAVAGEGQAGYFGALHTHTWIGSIDILTLSIECNGNSGAKFPHGDAWYRDLRLTLTSVCAQILVQLLGMIYNSFFSTPIRLFLIKIHSISEFSYSLIRCHWEICNWATKMWYRRRWKQSVLVWGKFLLSCLQRWQLDYVHPKID